MYARRYGACFIGRLVYGEDKPATPACGWFHL